MTTSPTIQQWRDARTAGFERALEGKGISDLLDHPRIASVDSMAWDFACRRERGPLPYSVETRSEWMRSWYRAQTDARARPGWKFQMGLFPAHQSPAPLAAE